jgi:hypothetical protein
VPSNSPAGQAMAVQAQRPQVRDVVGAAVRKRNEVVDFEPTTSGATPHAPIAVALENRSACALPCPAAAAARLVVAVRSRTGLHG